MNDTLKEFRRIVRQQVFGELPDGQLLDRFLTRREESAFTELVQRHARMVMGVCSRVLQDFHDAEDAFQATFLVLARKAASILPRDAVGAWLYGVAYRTAKKAKAMNAKRQRKERMVCDTRRSKSNPDSIWQDLHLILDEELERLPRKYQSAIVLCDLEGKTKRAAAGQLHCPEGTLSSWLVRGRRMLAKRLTRRGISLSGGSLAALLSENALASTVRTNLVASTAKAAIRVTSGQALTLAACSKVAALTEGVLKAMLLCKLKIAISVLLVVGCVVLGTANLSHMTQAAGPIREVQDQEINAAQTEPLLAQSGPDGEAARAQIDKILKVHGGEDRLRKLTTFTMTLGTASTISSQKDQYRFSVQLPDLARMEVMADGDRMGKLVSVKNGDKQWQKVNDGEVVECKIAKGALEFLGPRALLRLKDPAMKVTVLGERMAGDTEALLGDRAAICVELARKDGKQFFPLHAFTGGTVEEVKLYFDKESGLMLKEEFEVHQQRLEIFYTDYKVIGGIPVAQKLVHRTDGSVNYRSTVEFNVVDKLDAKLFEKP